MRGALRFRPLRITVVRGSCPLVGAVGLAACGSSHWAALRTSVLPIARAQSRLVSVAGLGQFGAVDRYRYIVIAGSRGESPAALMRTEVTAFRSRHWRLANSVRLVGLRAVAKHVPVGARGAIVTVDGPNDHEYAALSAPRSIVGLDGLIGDTPLDTHSKEIRGALRVHEPVLIVTCARRS